MNLQGKTLLNNPYLNKGTAFTEEERKNFQLDGLLPAGVETLEEQVKAAYAHIQAQADNYTKNQALLNIYNNNRVLYYAIVEAHLEELLPIIYTPTIADAVTNFSRDFVLPHDAAYLDTDHPEKIEASLRAASEGLLEVEAMVITDGEGVLGIGDWGVGGVMISVGKLAVYTAVAGLNPQKVLPVVIDNGTERKELLNDPNYIGLRKPRKVGQEYLDYIAKFVEVAKRLFPKVLFHWEDFGRGNAATILEKYRHELTTFNDDIQGTGIMMAATVYAASEISQTPITENKYLVFGGGTAGVGISDQIRQEMMLAGLSEAESYERFYMIDRYGLITDEMEDLTEGQRRYARQETELQGQTHLEEIIKLVRPSVLIGCSGQAGAFNENVVRAMSEINERPAILPISNPTKLCEATAEDIIKWSNGRALVVTGSPSAAVHYQGVSYQIGQANNALLYPGLGLGIIVAKAKTVTDNMLSAAANAISSLQDLSAAGASLLPPLYLAKEASYLVAKAVVAAAIDEGVATVEIKNIEEAIQTNTWQPSYEGESHVKS